MSYFDKRRIILPRGFLNDRQRLWFIRRRHDWHAGFDDAGFFGGDFFEGVAEPLLMIEGDVGDDAGQRRDDVGRIEPSAEAGFPNHEVAFLFAKKFQRHHRDDFKKRRVMVGGKLFQQRLQFRDEPDNLVFGNKLPVELNPFAEGNQMWRGEQPDAQAGRAVNAFEHGAGRAFAIGAGDVDEAEFFLRITRECGQLECVFQPELRAEQTQAVKKLNRFGVGHGCNLNSTAQRFESRRNFLDAENSASISSFQRKASAGDMRISCDFMPLQSGNSKSAASFRRKRVAFAFEEFVKFVAAMFDQNSAERRFIQVQLVQLRQLHQVFDVLQGAMRAALERMAFQREKVWQGDNPRHRPLNFNLFACGKHRGEIFVGHKHQIQRQRLRWRRVELQKGRPGKFDGVFQPFQEFLPYGGLRFSDEKINVASRPHKSVRQNRVAANQQKRQINFCRFARYVGHHAHDSSQRLLVDLLVRGGDEALEQWMRLVRLALKFRMKLARHEKRMVFQFNHLDELAIG